MKKIIITACFTCVSLFIVGCSNVRTLVIPKGSNNYEVAAYSTTNERALRGAMKVANKVCRSHREALVVISHNSEYIDGIKRPESKTQLNFKCA